MLMASIAVFILMAIGGMLLISGFFPGVSPGARRAVTARAGKKETLSLTLVNKISVKIMPFISIEPMKRQKLRQTLIVLGRASSPELFHAQAWSNGIIFSVGIFLIAPLLHLMTLLMMPGVFPTATIYQFTALLSIMMLFVGHSIVHKELSAELKKRQETIEWELPQFAGTILQSLKHTRNVIDILGSYKKICGPALKSEIERTLNDMRTGNHEQAINNLAARVNSGAFTQLTQGLIGILRGDDQTSYSIITNDFYGMQDRMIEEELLKRPGKLTVYNILLLAGMAAMFGVAIGGYVMDTSAGLF